MLSNGTTLKLKEENNLTGINCVIHTRQCTRLSVYNRPLQHRSRDLTLRARLPRASPPPFLAFRAARFMNKGFSEPCALVKFHRQWIKFTPVSL